MQARILVADDVEAIADALKLILETAGYRVTVTCKGKQVLPLMQELVPDLLLLDIWMSGYDGRDICRQIKQQEMLHHTPLLLISAHRDTPEIAKQTGADGYILKPFLMNTLLATVAATLEKGQAHAPLSEHVRDHSENGVRGVSG